MMRTWGWSANSAVSAVAARLSSSSTAVRLAASFGEGAGEDAAAGADFEDGVGGGEVCGGEDAGDDAAVNEEVLSEGFFGGEIAGFMA